jgi:hypothetical protein
MIAQSVRPGVNVTPTIFAIFAHFGKNFGDFLNKQKIFGKDVF